MKMCVLAAAGMLASIVGAYEEPVYTVTVAEGTNSLDAATVEVTQNGETVSAAFSSGRNSTTLPSFWQNAFIPSKHSCP